MGSWRGRRAAQQAACSASGHPQFPSVHAGRTVMCDHRAAHAVPTFCPQLQITSVNYRDVFSQLDGVMTP
jgi:hypothetical protein